jgi:hypothetical protein
MSKMTLFFRIIFTFVAMYISLGSTGCFVESDGDSVEPLPIRDNHLHIYQDGQFLEYNVDVIDSGQTGTQTGTLRIEYTTDSILENPLDTSSGLITVTKETTTLDYGSPFTTVRYFQQDPIPTDPLEPDTGGTVRLLAYNAQDSAEATTRLSTTQQPNDVIEPIVITESPFADVPSNDKSIEFYVFSNCAPTQCDDATQRYFELKRFSQFEFTTAETLLDFFNAYLIPYSGDISDYNITDDRKVRLDIRAFCGAVNEETVSFSGRQWIHPQVGVVRFVNTCTSTTFGTITVTGVLAHTNISLPSRN